MPYTKAFQELLASVQHEYAGKVVAPKYRHKYGKVYNESEAKSVAFAIAKSRGIKIH